MIWQVTKDGRTSFLVGTAHFFPYSFKVSLSRRIKESRMVMLEGPLDQGDMRRVREAGHRTEPEKHLFDLLDEQTIASITETLFPACRFRKTSLLFDFRTARAENPVYAMVDGMKPWLAFFTLWTTFLESKGWRFSVDLEAYQVALELGKEVKFLETIEEQTEVLENFSRERIMDHLRNVSRWETYAKEYAECYLNGMVERLVAVVRGLPGRHAPSGDIRIRDRIMYTRMKNELTKGGVFACVGAPHVPGIKELLQTDGYRVEKPADLSLPDQK